MPIITLTIDQFIFRLLLAFGLGAAIGIERQWRQKSAGLRTNTLVSIGAAQFVLLSFTIGGDATGRIASYIISGIGFLGAGVIMKDGKSVQGLNTAATIWCSAAVGCLAGMGLTMQAVIACITIIFTHLLLRPIGLKLSKLPFVKSETAQTDYVITCKCRETVENHIRVLLMEFIGNDERLLLRSLVSSDNGDPRIAIITADVRSVSPQEALMEKISGRLTIEKDVTSVSWEVVGEQTDI
ncbi:MAG: MgtC/SapB family protein [Sediminibacterium sp.]|nr:MgtC/SapB family protein [Sediminibacterium sp.]MBX9779785.1 MgtC/SapB family protein [Chitinophagaceae bacterium]